MFLFIHILAVDFHGNCYKYFTPKKHWQAYCLWTGWQKEQMPCHVSSISIYTSTPNTSNMSCANRAWSWRRASIVPSLCHEELAVKTLNTAVLTDTGQATVEYSQSDHLIELYLTSFLTAVEQQAALDIRQCSARVQTAKHRMCEQSCYVFKHYK